MSDIVERLRREAEIQRSPMENRGDERIALLLLEAADEIEKLRVVGSWDNKLNAIMQELKVVNVRLTNAGI